MIIGLTGGIASGKSTVAEYLKSRGALVLDGDILGHRAYAPHTKSFKQIHKQFGTEIIDTNGQIDRKVLGSKVFGNPDALKTLTDILWPEIRIMFSDWISSSKREDPNRLLVMDAAVLLEAGWESLANETWVIIVDSDIAIERAVKRDGLNKDDIRKRIAAQLSNKERAERANVVIDNSGTFETLISRVDTELTRIAQTPAATPAS